ncbi:hypothetical protein D047_0502A, partial [Vibrio parahaemolyticus VPTS-2010_2]
MRIARNAETQRCGKQLVGSILTFKI